MRYRGEFALGLKPCNSAVMPHLVQACIFAFICFAQDAVIMPGIIDIHAHLNEPGRDAWEGESTVPWTDECIDTSVNCSMNMNS